MPNVISRSVHRIMARIAHRKTFSGIHSPNNRNQKPIDPFYPKLFAVFKNGYSAEDLFRDIIAGITVGIVAMPLAMAFAIASGVNPIQGLYTAILAGVIIGVLGGSRFQVSGPTGAFVVIIYGIVYRHGYDGLMVTTLMAGVMLCLAGFFRLGNLIKFIPYPVTTGFTAGISIIVFSSQIGDLFGLSITQVPPEFISKWILYLSEIGTTSPITLGIGLITLVIMITIKCYAPKIPAPVLGVVVGGLLVWFLDAPVETIASRYGAIPAVLPSFQWPEINMAIVQMLLPDAITIAILAGLESLLTCVVADSMTGDKHYSNMELVAQGTGNIACAVLGGIPATGAIARTATNISSGARSPLSAIIHGITVLVFVLWLSPLTSAIPLTCLAAVMIIISYGMLEVNSIRNIFRGPKSDWMVMVLSFALTVLLDLTVAVYIGVLVASLLFMRRMSEASSIQEVKHETIVREEGDGLVPVNSTAEGVHLFSISGPFFFGMVDRFQHAVNHTNKNVKVYVLQMRDVSTIDATGIHVLEAFLAHRVSRSYQVVLAEVPASTRRILRRMGILRSLGEDNVCHSLQIALQRAADLADEKS